MYVRSMFMLYMFSLNAHCALIPGNNSSLWLWPCMSAQVGHISLFSHCFLSQVLLTLSQSGSLHELLQNTWSISHLSLRLVASDLCVQRSLSHWQNEAVCEQRHSVQSLVLLPASHQLCLTFFNDLVLSPSFIHKIPLFKHLFDILCTL